MMDLSSTNIETERAVIASIIVDGGCITEIAPILTPDMLEDKALCSIYKSMLKIYDKGSSIDLITLSIVTGKQIGRAHV